MPTPLDVRLELPADPVRAYELLTEPAYVTAVAQATGGHDVAVTVEEQDDATVVTSRRTLPARLPAFAKALVGDTVTLTEQRSYGPARPDGSRDGTVRVDFDGAPLTVEGTLALTADPAGSVCAMSASVRASVPFIGGKVERLAAEQIQAFIAKESEVAADRLG